jgi:hypothetical protein
MLVFQNGGVIHQHVEMIHLRRGFFGRALNLSGFATSSSIKLTEALPFFAIQPPLCSRFAMARSKKNVKALFG